MSGDVTGLVIMVGVRILWEVFDLKCGNSSGGLGSLFFTAVFASFSS